MTTHAARWRCALIAATPISVGAQTLVDEVEVVATSPLGEARAIDVPANVQVLHGDDLRRLGALDLTGAMNRGLGSIFASEAQGNPLQPDLMYRGFVGSHLLGLPQGIAVYQDGVRINEPFGDTVNWALIPAVAIDTLQVLPGSDPLFGLNALGGTIAVRTKSGFSHAGARVAASTGSFGRSTGEVEAGGQISETLALFGSASYVEEDGWRDFSGTEALQAFGSLRFEAGPSTAEGKLTLVDTDLTGNGPLPVQLLQSHRTAVFTHPDNTRNQLQMLNLIASHELSVEAAVTGNAFMRRSDVTTVNGDDSDYEPCAQDPAVLCLDDEVALDTGGQPIAAEASVQGATLNRSRTEQDGLGFGLQASYRTTLAGLDHQFLAGLAYDRGDVEFSSSSELGALDDSRGAVAGGVLVAEAMTGLSTRTRNASLFFSDHVDVGERLRLGIAGRFTRTEVRLDDRLGTALNGDHEFRRFNPGASVMFSQGAARAYLRYSQSSRVPSPVELTCADEADPCRLPNAFLSDPPLDMVVASTWEAGARGGGEALHWHVGAFHATNDDDIIFISAGSLANEGFFDNVGQTRRAGVELNLDGRILESIRWSIDYTYMQANFLDDFDVASPNNPAAVDGEIAVRRGDRLPLVPEHLLKAGIDWAPVPRFRAGLDVQAASDIPYRGDEGNDVGSIAGYVVLNASASYSISQRLRVYVDVSNILDAEFETFGLFGDATDVLGEAFDDTRFLSPGAPRGAWIGFEFAIDE